MRAPTSSARGRPHGFATGRQEATTGLIFARVAVLAYSTSVTHLESPDPVPVITKRVIIIGGFLQDRWSSGITQIHRAIDSENHLNEHVAVTSHSWNERWPQFVDHILRTGPFPSRRLDVRIIAYSWGVGYGAMTLARLLQGQGISVNRLASCDGVYYSRWARWRSLCSPVLGEPRIVLPANIKQVDFLRQETNWPRGHFFTKTNGTELVDRGVLRGRTHQDVDNSPEFFDLAMEVAA